MRGPIRTILLTALALCAFAALTAGSASATEITPANTAFTGSLTGLPNGQILSVFIPTNAFDADGIACTTSTITGTTPTAIAGTLFNQNKPEVGTHSQGYGSVITNIEASFSGCGVYEWTSAKKWVSLGIPATVTTTKKSPEDKGWTFAAYRDLVAGVERQPYTAAGVPPSGATIEIPGVSKVIVSPNVASSVFGEWTNGKATEASKDRVDGQISYEATPALGESPAQFEATYSVVKTGTTEGIIIKA